MVSTSQTQKPALVVLAAGIGSRYGGLKQMDPVGPHGELIIDYSIYDALRAGFGKLIFVIRRDIEALFKEKIGRHFTGRVEVEYVCQELSALPEGFSPPPDRVKPWGTGQAILVCREAARGPFAAINADDFYGASSFQKVSDFLSVPGRSGAMDYAMVGFVLRNTLSEFGHVSRGVCRLNSADELQGVVERTHVTRDDDGAHYVDQKGERGVLSGDEIVSMNLWGFNPSLFERLQREFIAFLRRRGHEGKSEFLIPSVVDGLLAEGKVRVKVLRSPDSWFGVTHPQDKAAVVQRIRELIDRGIYPEKLWS